MSKYENQFDDCNVICPYCKYLYQREAEDEDYNERSEQCGGCGKKFLTLDEVSTTKITRPDCLSNGESHDMVPSQRIAGYGTCKICGTVEVMK